MKLKLLYLGLVSFVSLSGWSMYHAFTDVPTNKVVQEYKSEPTEATEQPLEAPKNSETPKPVQIHQPITLPKPTSQPQIQAEKRNNHRNYDPDSDPTFREVDKILERVEKDRERFIKSSAEMIESYNQLKAPASIPSVQPIKPVDSRPKCSSLLVDCVKQKQELYGSGPIGAVIQYKNDCNRQISYMDCK
jgi:hypothetical protein